MDLLRTAMANTTRQVQLAIVSSLLLVTGKMEVQFLSDFIKESNRILTPSMDVANFSALRIEALKVLVLLIKQVQSAVEPSRSESLELIRHVYTLRVEEFLRDTSPEVKSRADEAKRLMSAE